MFDRPQLVPHVIEIARDAGRAIERVRATGFGVEQKGAAGPVTQADRAADALLKRRLLHLVDAAWLSEETADRPDRLTAERLWIVDPLDGTKEFVSGLPEYTVAIALAEAGQPVLAVVHNPATDDMFWATQGGGAFRNGEPIRVAEGERLLASRSELTRGEFDPFQDAWHVDPVGSIEYKLALVAAGEGAATVSRGPKHEWDVCAGALLIVEAGGIVTDAFEGPLQYNQSFPKVKGIMAGAPDAYRRMARQVRETGASDRMREFDSP